MLRRINDNPDTIFQNIVYPDVYNKNREKDECLYKRDRLTIYKSIINENIHYIITIDGNKHCAINADKKLNYMGIVYLFEFMDINNKIRMQNTYYTDVKNYKYNKGNIFNENTLDIIYDSMMILELDIKYDDLLYILSKGGFEYAREQYNIILRKKYKRIMRLFMINNLKIKGIHDVSNTILDYCI